MNRNEWLRMKERRIMIKREPASVKVLLGICWFVIVGLMVVV